MSNSNKGFTNLLFSTVGIVGVALLLIAINVIAAVVNGRLDMTEEKRYTLSQGTKNILRDMDAPVSIRFYFTRTVDDMPLWMKNYAPRVRDMLKEYELLAKGKLTIEEKNPEPDSDDEESAALDGIYSQLLATGEQIYFGLGISCLEETTAIPVLSPREESMLEYEITRSIYQVLNPEQPVVGVMSTLPVMGQQPNMMMMQQGMRPQGTPPWYIIQDLKRDFEVREISTDTDAIDDDVDILVLVHPNRFTDNTLYAIDQYVLGGGKLVAFLDPMSYIENAQQQSNPMMGPRPGEPSDLAPLLEAWGVEFNSGQILADLQYELEFQDRNGQFQRDPFMLNVDKDAFNTDDPTTSKLDTGFFGYPGAFTGTPVEGLEKTVLVQSSIDSSLVDSMKARMSIPQVVKGFDSSGVRHALSIRLTGTFPTAFPDGGPAADEQNDDAEDNGEEAGEDEAEAATAALTSGDSAVVLVADSDLLHDAFCVRRINMLGQTLLEPTSDNVAFVHNLVEHLTGDLNLLSVRSLGIKSRPFTKIQDIRAKAEKQYQEQITKLEDELSKINTELRELQRSKRPDQRFVLSPEQEAKLLEAQRKKSETAQQLKEVRKEFRKEIDALQGWLKFGNIAAVPAVVALVGISIAFIKRRRMASK